MELNNSTDKCHESFVNDFCPYNGNPDPWEVWQAAWKSFNKSLVGAESYPPQGRWIAFEEKKPPVSAAIDDPKVKTGSRVLVTNNIKARDRMGRMSHVWFSTPIQHGKEWVAFDEAGRQIEFLTHWFDPFADAISAPQPLPELPEPTELGFDAEEGVYIYGYTADDMRDYASAVLAFRFNGEKS